MQQFIRPTLILDDVLLAYQFHVAPFTNMV